MAKIKLTQSAVDAAQPQAQAVELRDTLVPGLPFAIPFAEWNKALPRSVCDGN